MKKKLALRKKKRYNELERQRKRIMARMVGRHVIPSIPEPDDGTISFLPHYKVSPNGRKIIGITFVVLPVPLKRTAPKLIERDGVVRVVSSTPLVKPMTQIPFVFNENNNLLDQMVENSKIVDS